MTTTLLNMSGIYEKQNSLYNNEDITVVNCRDIEGTNGYCDDQAYADIMNRITEVSAKGIHFIDSGNYHYLTKIMLEKLENECPETPYNLVVFDHHSDMKRSAFFDILSCGSWILDACLMLKNINKVLLIGIDEEQRNLIPEVDTDIEVLMDSDARNLISESVKTTTNINSSPLYEFLITTLDTSLPLYISIDKDFLSKEVLNTTWDQGSMNEEEFYDVMDILCKTDYKVLGVDINGDADEHNATDEDIRKNEEFNINLLNYLNNSAKL